MHTLIKTSLLTIKNSLLYDAHESKNPEFPYWNYERVDLEGKTNDECTAEFREDIYEVADQMKLLDDS